MSKTWAVLMMILSILALILSFFENNKNKYPVRKPSPNGYEIIKARSVYGGIKIHYPQLVNFNKYEKQKRINELIRKEVLKVLEPFRGMAENLNLNLDYVIRWSSLNLLSVEYLGTAQKNEDVDSSNIISTTNIDLYREEIIILKNIINIDGSFTDKVVHGGYIPFNPELNIEASNIFDSIDAESIYFIKNFNQENSKFYFNKESLGISIAVPHNFGDHAEFEIAYEDLVDNIISDNMIMDEFTREIMNMTGLQAAFKGKWMVFAEEDSEPIACNILEDKFELFNSDEVPTEVPYKVIHGKGKGEKDIFDFFPEDAEYLVVDAYYNSLEITKRSVFSFNADKDEMEKHEVSSENSNLLMETPVELYKLTERMELQDSDEI